MLHFSYIAALLASMTWFFEFGQGLPAKQSGAAAEFKISRGVIPSYLFAGNPAERFRRRVPGDAQFRIVVQFDAAADTEWNTNPKGEFVPIESPPFVTPVLWETTRWGSFKSGASDRWYAGTSRVNIEGSGRATIAVPLKPHLWSNVWGKAGNLSSTHLKKFNETLLSDNLAFGVCFGGMFYGHGVTVRSGSSSIRISQPRIA